MTYHIISTFDGSITNCSLSELSRKLKLNCILAELNGDGTVVGDWPLVHETLVTFAVEFSDYALKNYIQKKTPEAEACIALTRRWLKNHDSVSVEELMAAATAGAGAAAPGPGGWRGGPARCRAAGYATYAAAAAADSTYAAANAAAYAADAAANAAANAAAYAAYAADAAANAATVATYAATVRMGREAEYVRQGQFIVKYMKAADTRSCDSVAA